MPKLLPATRTWCYSPHPPPSPAPNSLLVKMWKRCLSDVCTTPAVPAVPATGSGRCPWRPQWACPGGWPAAPPRAGWSWTDLPSMCCRSGIPAQCINPSLCTALTTTQASVRKCLPPNGKMPVTKAWSTCAELLRQIQRTVQHGLIIFVYHRKLHAQNVPRGCAFKQISLDNN